MNRNARRLLSIFTCVIIVAMSCLSLTYIAEEACHDCSGAGCQVCLSVHNAENNIREIGAGKAAGAIIATVIALITVSILHFFAEVITFSTPVSNKVRLNN